MSMKLENSLSDFKRSPQKQERNKSENECASIFKNKRRDPFYQNQFKRRHKPKIATKINESENSESSFELSQDDLNSPKR